MVPRSDRILTSDPTVEAHGCKFATALIGEVLLGRRDGFRLGSVNT